MKLYKKNEPIIGQLLHFCDGDTVFARLHCPCCGLSRTLYIRLAGIESYEPRGATRSAALEIARKWTQTHTGKDITVIPSHTGSDRYGRLIGQVFQDGNSLAELLVRSGDAWYASVLTNN